MSLQGAVNQGIVEKVKRLVEEKGMSIKDKDKDGNTLLHGAAEYNHNVEVLEYLISKGMDVNVKNKYGHTPLHYAARSSNNVEVLECLISNGADVNAKNNGDITPLHCAAGSDKRNVETLKCLISKGADVNAKDCDNDTPLHFATKPYREKAYNAPCIEVLECLISNGADINAKNYHNDTPLHMLPYVYGFMHIEIIPILKKFITNGADVNVKGKDGMTLLHKAVKRGGMPDGTASRDSIQWYEEGMKYRTRIWKYLISNGADKNIAGNAGKTPLDYYKEYSKIGGCYVATCVYGSYNCPEVWILRRFRDNKLSNLWFGRLFIRVYYAASPKIVKLFGSRKWFNKVCKPVIDKLVVTLQNNGMESSPHHDL